MKPNRLLLVDNTNYTHMFSFTPAFKIHCCHLVPGSAVIGSHYAKQFGYCWLLVNEHKPSQVKLTARGRNVGPRPSKDNQVRHFCGQAGLISFTPAWELITEWNRPPPNVWTLIQLHFDPNAFCELLQDAGTDSIPHPDELCVRRQHALKVGRSFTDVSFRVLMAKTCRK